ncbi:hypothetical protein BGZ65_003387, partial [Modicella reniformis]
MSKLTPVPNPNTMPVTDRPRNLCPHPWSVYGPAFQRLSSSKIKGSHRRRRDQPPYPSDSILVPSDRSEDSSYSSLDDSDSAIDDEDFFYDDTRQRARLAAGWSNLSYAEMPLELLGTIFRQFMYISRESLDQLAQDRNRARTHASQGYPTMTPPIAYCGSGMAQGWQGQFHDHHTHAMCGSFWLDGTSPGTVQQYTGSDASSSTSHSRRTSVHLSSTATDPDIDYDGEDDDEYTEVDSDSGDEVTQSKTWDAAGTLVNKMSSLAIDTSKRAGKWAPGVNTIEDEDSGSTSSGSHNIGYEYRNDSMEDMRAASLSSRSDTYNDEDDFEGSARSASRSPTIVASTMSSSGSPKPFFHSALGQNCHHMCLDTYVPPPVPGHSINRVDNTLPEEEMLYELHRDQYFHPTTHTSLRSDLYNCSLVNRQWRVAALQILWQSIVLDSESCRPEPMDPCTRCTHILASKQGRRSTRSMSSASSCSSSPPMSSPTSSPTHYYSSVRRTRFEAMLDSYLEMYGLDLAKCVRTVELDLRLLAWPAEGEAVKRILRRLSPFTHLRLVWAEDESSEELIAGFRVVMESLHSQIRHLHFLSGFVISKPWVHEMERMTRLETVTLDQPGSLDPIEYDWRRIRCLRMNAFIPRYIFESPTAMTMDGAMTVATTGASTPQQGSGTSDLPRMSLPMSGWWQWTGLRKIEIRMKNTVLPHEWLQDLTNVITENVLTFYQQLSQANSEPRMLTSAAPSMPHGPPLEVLSIDCE